MWSRRADAEFGTKTEAHAENEASVNTSEFGAESEARAETEAYEAEVRAGTEAYEAEVTEETEAGAGAEAEIGGKIEADAKTTKQYLLS